MHISKVWWGEQQRGCVDYIICTVHKDDGDDLGFHSASRAIIHVLWGEVPVRGGADGASHMLWKE